MAKVTFSNRRNILSSKLDFNLRKKLIKCHIYSIAFCSAGSWILHKIDQKYQESFEMWCWKRMKISWTDRLKRRILRRAKTETKFLHKTRRWKPNWISYIWHRNYPIKHAVLGKTEGTRRGGRKRKQLLEDLKGKEGTRSWQTNHRVNKH
jgi:hypothetical protein